MGHFRHRIDVHLMLILCWYVEKKISIHFHVISRYFFNVISMGRKSASFRHIFFDLISMSECNLDAHILVRFWKAKNCGSFSRLFRSILIYTKANHLAYIEPRWYRSRISADCQQKLHFTKPDTSGIFLLVTFLEKQKREHGTQR